MTGPAALLIPLLLGDSALPDSLRRNKVVAFREESEAAFAEGPSNESIIEDAAVEWFGDLGYVVRCGPRARDGLDGMDVVEEK